MNEKKKKIHVDLSEIVHQKLRVEVALLNVSVQWYVEKLIEEAVKNIRLDNIKKNVY